MKLLITFLFSFAFSICNSQNEKPEREAFKLNLAVNKEQYYSADIVKTPYLVKEKILQIYPGEKVFIETEVKGDTIFSMKTVKKNIHPKETIVVDFSQESSDRKNINMLLNVKNPFNRTLNHDALMYTAQGAKWEKTSIVPIRPKLQNFETWGYTIITLVLNNWRFE